MSAAKACPVCGNVVTPEQFDRMLIAPPGLRDPVVVERLRWTHEKPKVDALHLRRFRLTTSEPWGSAGLFEAMAEPNGKADPRWQWCGPLSIAEPEDKP